jgi:hypothetical protein
MPSHKFHVGDSVMVKPSISRNVPGGVYEVIKQLPHNGREYEYRITSANEEHERVAGDEQGVSRWGRTPNGFIFRRAFDMASGSKFFGRRCTNDEAG